MGYAIFAARKIMLTNRINTLNFRIMALSQKQQSLADQGTFIGQIFGQLGSQLNQQYQQGGLSQMTQYGQGAAGIAGGGTDLYSNINGVLSQYSGMQGYLNQMQSMFMYGINQMEKQIEAQRKALETQLAAANAELQKVEEAEQKQIERSAPKFA